MRRLLLSLLLIGLSSPACAAAPIEGRWLTEGGRALVTIEKCGKVACGRITRVLIKTPTASPTDRYNPDVKLRGRAILGMEILTGFKDAGDDWRGTIYDPEHGKTYKSILKREPAGLNVKGCIMVFCQAQHWTAAK
jgi:uncharacterized protein (DUF2147 family)